MTGSSGTHWQCQLASSGERLALLRETGLLSDLTISFPGHRKVFQVHRLVLAMSSPVFEVMLCGPLAEGEVLSLPEDPPEAFEWILDHMYRDNNQLPDVAMAIKVYLLAAKYQLDVLGEICSQYLIGEVNSDNFPLIFDTAVLLEDRHLLNRCGEVLAVSSDKILACPEIINLRRTPLTHLLSHTDLDPSSEILVFNALLKWGEARIHDYAAPLSSRVEHQPHPVLSGTNQDTRSLGEPKSSARSNTKRGDCQAKCNPITSHPTEDSVVKPLVEAQSVVGGFSQGKCPQNLHQHSALRCELEEFLHHVKFLSMNTDEFVATVLPSGVFTSEESIAILMNIKGVPNVPLPSILALQDKKQRQSRIKSASLMFCQHHFGLNDQEILKEFTVSKSICVSKITAPAVLSLKDTDVTVLATLKYPRIVKKAKWKGTCCEFEEPLKLIPQEAYSVMVSSAYGSCSGCECQISSEMEGLHINGKTIGLSPVYLNYWDADI